MNVITIPKKLARKDGLVIIPQKEYEEFSRWKKTVRVQTDEQWFWTQEWQKKEQEADEAIRSGKLKGPFTDSKKLLVALKAKRK